MNIDQLALAAVPPSRRGARSGNVSQGAGLARVAVDLPTRRDSGLEQRLHDPSDQASRTAQVDRSNAGASALTPLVSGKSAALRSEVPIGTPSPTATQSAPHNVWQSAYPIQGQVMESLSINPARVDFVTLRLFCLVAQLGSISKGASRCHIAISAASRRLADLEATVGTALLERTGQGIHLTPAGHFALQHAVRLCQGFELFGAELSDYTRGYRGHVRLWANMSSLTEDLPDALACFMQRHPEIKIDIEEQLSSDTVRALIDGLADIGVIADGNPTHGLIVAPFLSDDLVVACPAEHPIAMQDEVDFASCLPYPFIGLNRGSSLLDLITATARDAGVPLLLRVQVRSFQAMFRMIRAKLGIGVVPRTVCEPLLASYNLKAVPLTDAWAHRQLLLARHSDRPLSPATQVLWEHLSALGQR